MESPVPLDFSNQEDLPMRSSEATRELARKQGAVMPPDDDKMHSHFQPRFVTQDPPPGALLCTYGDTQSKVADNTDTASGKEESAKSIEAGTSNDRVTSGSDEGSEELRLIRASESFDAQIEQYRPPSRIEQPDRSLHYRRGANTSYPHRRQFESYSSTHSGAMTNYQGGGPPNEDDSHRTHHEIANRIKALTLLLGRSGTPSDSSYHTSLLNEIGQLVTTAICNLRFERDTARNELDRVRHRTHRDNVSLRTEIRRLQEEVKKAENREKVVQANLDLAKVTSDCIKEDYEKITKAAEHFRDHHLRVREELAKRDEAKILRIESLEGEVKRLRTRNAQFAKAAGLEPDHDSTPSAPDSQKEDAEARHDFLYGMLKKKSDEQEDKQSKKHQKRADKSGSKKYASSPEDAPKSSMFNPKAPAFQPPLSSKNLAAVGDSGPGQSPTGGPSNWPAVRFDLPSAGDEKRQYEGYNPNRSGWYLDDVDKEIQRMTLIAKGYIVRCHKKGEPTNVSYKMLSRKEETTWKYLTNLVFTDNVFQAESRLTELMDIEQHRPFLVMRCLQDYLFRNIVSPSVFLGFDEKLDRHLAALQDRIAQFGKLDYPCNPHDRQAVLNDHARIIDEALKSPDMETFRANTINRHSQILSGILHPLRGVKVAEKDADAGIRALITISWDMSSKIWTSGMMLSYYFPPCGSRFTENNMKARNLAAFDLEAQIQLQYMHARVELAMSPVLSLRDNRDGEIKGACLLSKAEVLAMK
ncbi:uncharacterized protein F4807DRAFT_459562 [Annulohypoxylon truncatum]|uniref:uncharacterized protein n=1 Tax=Annulohypoxylon truncatum TaxID=327061 RepID=UPI00200779C8|nr:uncharacterized protein F4807DRAFT_459562 [Annulohypoxylon truncatum]KAI1210721.1 hypothetical protein F4807DRAFT_459562 [Annulohypoxylon truncatum]